jgi:hypothetical protein
MKRDEPVINWLLEDDNPAVKHRTLTELLSKDRTDNEVVGTRKQVLKTLHQAVNTSWIKNTKGLWLTYNLLALAECGLTKEDIDVSDVFKQWPEEPSEGGLSGIQYSGQFDAACGEALLLRALLALGYKDNTRVQGWLKAFSESIMPDGGFLCFHWRPRFKYTPKSCIKDNMQVLLMLAEGKKQGLEFEYAGKLLEYFLRHRVFYRTSEPDKLVLDYERPGQRMTDNFFPAQPMRVGLPQLLYALSLLGVGKRPELREAWELSLNKKDKDGKSILEGTLVKSYLPRERIGKPSKWVTLYTLLAEKYKIKGYYENH